MGTRIDVPVEGGSLAAYRLGSAPSGAPLVVCAHGITANSHSWVRVARALEGRAELVAVDLRGRGESAALPGPFGTGAHAADLLAVLDALGAERALLAGHSMGAYIVARLAVDALDRCSAAVLVDGGLALPMPAGIDPQDFLEAFLGLSLARLGERFESAPSYHAFWRTHPAFGATGVEDADLAAFADHDLVGEHPELRPSVAAEAVRADAAELVAEGARWAQELAVRATLLRAPRGLQDEPSPIISAGAAAAWAVAAPELRDVVEVDDVNHYTIALGPGATAVADTIAGLAGGE